MGRPLEAITDFTLALDSDPSLVLAKRRRAQAQLLAGDFKAAVSDFDSLTTPRLTDSIWRFIAAKRSGQTDAEIELTRMTKGIDPTQWPGALVDGLEGQVTIETVLNEATRDSAKADNRLTESHFVIGQLALAAGDMILARASFSAALARGSHGLIEYQGAVLELRRLETDNSQ